MPKDKLNIGIVGLGNISDVHIRAIKVASNCEAISVYSGNKDKAEKVSAKYNLKGYTDWNRFLNDERLDAVSICTPSGNHLDYAGDAANEKKHVIVEKPIEVTIPRANELIRTCEENNVKLAVIYQNRFIEDVIRMKKELVKETIGKVFMGDAYVKWYRSQEYYDSGEWRGTFKLDGGGVLINQAIHTIDLLLCFMGEVRSVYGTAGTFTHNNIEGEDNAVGILKFKSGAMGVLQASTSIVPSMSRRIEIHGEKGTALLEGDKFHLLLTKEDKDKLLLPAEPKGSGSSSPMDNFSAEPHKKQFEKIADAILNNRQPVVPGIESLQSLALVKALYESAALDKPVIIDDYLKSFTNK